MFRGTVVTQECVEKLIKKDMIDPVSGDKLSDKDIIPLQRVCMHFCVEVGGMSRFSLTLYSKNLFLYIGFNNLGKETERILKVLLDSRRLLPPPPLFPKLLGAFHCCMLMQEQD